MTKRFFGLCFDRKAKTSKRSYLELSKTSTSTQHYFIGVILTSRSSKNSDLVSNADCDNDAGVIVVRFKNRWVCLQSLFDVFFFSLTSETEPEQMLIRRGFVTQQVHLGRQLHPGSGCDLRRGQGDQNIEQLDLWKAKDGGWLCHWLLPPVVSFFFFFFLIEDFFRLHSLAMVSMPMPIVIPCSVHCRDRCAFVQRKLLCTHQPVEHERGFQFNYDQ